jgi:hypothetical protein
MSDAGFLVRGSDMPPIGAVIVGANGKFAGWNRAGKIGEFDLELDAVAAVKKAHFARTQREEKSK